VTQLEAEIRYHILSVLHDLDPFEQVIVKSRVKDCESAIRKLLGEGNVFVPEKQYSLLDLKDLAGARVLVFPSKRLSQIDDLLRASVPFRGWTPHPLLYAGKTLQAPKYYGVFESVSGEIQGEYQIVPMLLGNFWEVEHSAIYKPVGWAKGADRDDDLKALIKDIELALSRFEEKFERFVEKNRDSSTS
jgi:hypothetical protein